MRGLIPRSPGVLFSLSVFALALGGWTPAAFVAELRACARRYEWSGPLYPCLDHGGPWLKDRHTLDHLSLDGTMARVKDSLTA